MILVFVQARIQCLHSMVGAALMPTMTLNPRALQKLGSEPILHFCTFCALGEDAGVGEHRRQLAAASNNTGVEIAGDAGGLAFLYLVECVYSFNGCKRYSLSGPLDRVFLVFGCLLESSCV